MNIFKHSPRDVAMRPAFLGDEKLTWFLRLAFGGYILYLTVMTAYGGITGGTFFSGGLIQVLTDLARFLQIFAVILFLIPKYRHKGDLAFAGILSFRIILALIGGTSFFGPMIGLFIVLPLIQIEHLRGAKGLAFWSDVRLTWFVRIVFAIWILYASSTLQVLDMIFGPAPFEFTGSLMEYVTYLEILAGLMIMIPAVLFLGEILLVATFIVFWIVMFMNTGQPPVGVVMFTGMVLLLGQLEILRYSKVK